MFGHDQRVQESHRLARFQQQAAHAVLEGQHPVVPFAQVVHLEVPLLVATGHVHRLLLGGNAVHRTGLVHPVGGVGDHKAVQIAALHAVEPRHLVGAVGHHRDADLALIGLVGQSIQHLPAQGHAVDAAACGKDIFIALQRVALVEVHNGSLELKQISGIGPQRVLQLHHHGTTLGTVLWLGGHRGRNQNIFVGILHADILVKQNRKLLACPPRGAARRRNAEHLGRCLVLGAARRHTRLGTSCQQRRQGHPYHKIPTSHQKKHFYPLSYVSFAYHQGSTHIA